jgi:outer membrane protein assembly factor BamA
MSLGEARAVRVALAILVALVTTVLLPKTAPAHLVVDHIVPHGKNKTTLRVLSGRMNLHPGDAVDFADLANAEQRLVESDLFATARVWIDMPRTEAALKMYADDEDYPVDVQVEVSEKHSWFVAPMASFGSGDYAGGLAYGDRNLLGHDLQTISAAQIGQSRSFVFAGFRDPLVVGAPLTWGVEGLYRYEQIRFFDNHRRILQVPTFVGGGGGELGWVLSRHMQALLGFSARSQRVHAAEVLVPDATPPAYNSRNGRIFLLVFNIRYDNTVAPEGLRRGTRLQFKNEVSDRYWGSQFDYSRFEARTELYGKLAWNYPSLTFVTILNFPTSSRGVPITEMLRIGGPNLRGYLVNEFHGDTLVSAQMEDQVVALRDLPLPLSDTRFNIAAAVFVDVAALLERHPGGTAVELPVRARPKLDDFHTSVGAGIRFILPGVAIPAIKADFGYGIDVHSFALTVSIAGGS